jgi:hypothetical protein
VYGSAEAPRFYGAIADQQGSSKLSKAYAQEMAVSELTLAIESSSCLALLDSSPRQKVYLEIGGNRIVVQVPLEAQAKGYQ